MRKCLYASGALFGVLLFCAALVRVNPEALAFTCAACTSADQTNCKAVGQWVQWCHPPSTNLSADADEEGDFSVDTEVKWCLKTGTHGGFQAVAQSAHNIVNDEDGITYSPAYFFPSPGCEVLEVTISGRLEDTGSDGDVDNRVWTWPPYVYDDIQLDISKP